MTPMQWTAQQGIKAFSIPARLKPGQRLNAAAHLDISRRIADGQGQARIARETGVTESTVHRIMKKARQCN